MSRKRAVLSVMLIVLLGGQWLVPPHVLHVLWGAMSMARPLPEHLGHFGHSAHGHSSSSTVTPLQHHCCDDGTPGTHENLCCGACPALPGAIADPGFPTPSLSLIIVEPQEKGPISLALLWHPPTL